MRPVKGRIVALALLAGLAACRASEQQRAERAQRRESAHAAVESSTVVRELRTQTAAGFLIYDKPLSLADTTVASRERRK